MSPTSILDGPNAIHRPNILASGFNPLLRYWGDFFVSKSIHNSRIIPNIYSNSLRGKTIFQKNGLRFEKNVLNALMKSDFLENLFSQNATKFDATKANATSAMFQNVKNATLQNATKLIPDFQILHNPHFSYFLNKKQKLCIPDILIIFSNAKNFDATNAMNRSAKIQNNQNAKTQNTRKLNLPFDLNLGVTNVTDIMNQEQFIICIEVKLTYVDSAISKLKNLYLPVVHQTFNLPVFPLVIVKNLTSFSPISKTTINDSLFQKIPLLQFFGNKFDRIY